MIIATFSSNLRIALASLALTAGLFSAGCSAADHDGVPGGESVDQSAQAQTATPPVSAPAEAVRRYPPHGYPCLGCHPCGTSYCDDFSNAIVCTGSGGPVATDVATSKASQ